MTALKTFQQPERDPMAELSDRLERLDSSLSQLDNSLKRASWLGYCICTCVLLLTLAAIGLLICVAVVNVRGAHVRPTDVIEFQGLYHAPWCERLHGQRAVVIGKSHAGHLGACPDCIRGG